MHKVQLANRQNAHPASHSFRRGRPDLLYFLGKTVASFHRSDLIALSRTTTMMRDHLLVNLLPAENGVTNGGISKRIGRHLIHEQTQCSQELPAFGLDEISLREAQQRIAAVHLRGARNLAKECSAKWPLEFEQATKRLLNTELQSVGIVGKVQAGGL